MFIVKNINHWKCTHIPARPPKGKVPCTLPCMGRLSGFHHSLNCVAQNVDHDTGTHVVVMFQLNFTVMLKLVHHSHCIFGVQKEFQPFILQQIFCQVYQGCSRLTHSPSQGFPALSFITWHFVHMGSTQQTKRSAGALGRSPFVSDCMGACLRVMGICWVLWGNCDFSTIPTCLFLNVCVGSPLHEVPTNVARDLHRGVWRFPRCSLVLRSRHRAGSWLHFFWGYFWGYLMGSMVNIIVHINPIQELVQDS